MRIYKMTATFGKLENATLTLEPGLNILTAPNEWGKSTWCAFLMAMLYGIDTRSKSTKTVLADKERYVPWSGAPMAGRIDLCWQGRDITIERTTKGRVPLGQFQAYETDSGLKIPELTASNCGQTLLGVEQTVFRRAGFIRQADLPVSQDEALRRRLNALVTTGDESGAADVLADKLRELKNRVRYNRSGLLPQLEGERDALREKLEEWEVRHSQCLRLTRDLEQIQTMLERLKNHQQWLAYEQAQADQARVSAAGAEAAKAWAEKQRLEERCAALPGQEEAERKLREIRSFREEWDRVQEEAHALPNAPEAPQVPPVFAGKTLEGAREMVEKDTKAYQKLLRPALSRWMKLVGWLGLLGGILLIFLGCGAPGAAAMGAGAAALLWSALYKRSCKKQAMTLAAGYGGGTPEAWMASLDRLRRELAEYSARMREYQQASGDVDVQRMVLNNRRTELCGDKSLEAAQQYWQEVLQQWSACHAATREALRHQSHVQDLTELVKTVPQPQGEDTLTSNAQQTLQLLAEGTAEQQRLQRLLGQYQGRVESLGDKAQLQAQLEQKQRRIEALEHTFGALTLAQETLMEARSELQRRFAPKIAKRAQELLAAMTGGRYHSLTMGSDFTLQAGAGAEPVLHDALWRSDGTVDQLYLSLRLAVAEALTPQAPLILDDALVRFDDERMKQSVGLLREIAEQKQVLLFTCQGRETNV